MQIKRTDTIVTITITITFNDCIDAELGSSSTGTFSVNHFEISVWWIFSHFRLLSPITVDRAMANRIFSVNLVLCVTTMSSNCEWFINKLNYDIWCFRYLQHTHSQTVYFTYQFLDLLSNNELSNKIEKWRQRFKSKHILS